MSHSKFPLAIYFTYGNVCVSILLSQILIFVNSQFLGFQRKKSFSIAIIFSILGKSLLIFLER